MSLFQTIQGFLQSKYKTDILVKCKGFLHIYFLNQISMKKITLGIHPMDLPSKPSKKSKNQSNIVHDLCNKEIVNAFLLRKPLGYQNNLVTFNNTIGSEFGLIDPSTLHHNITLQSRN